MKLTKKRWSLLLGVVVAMVIFAAFALNRGDSTQYFTAKVERGDIRDVVEATGTINAVTTVQVGSQVSGTISELHADFNSRVKKGEIIARIDPSIFQGALLQAQADLENARANAAAAKANATKARAAEEQARTQYQRTQSLANQGVMSQQQLEVDRANAESAAAALGATEAEVGQAAAQSAQKAAAVAVARTNLDHTIIRAPIDGTVVNRSVDVGQTVAASLQAPTLFVIAQDLTKMQVYAKTDESDVGQIKSAQRVTFKVDAFPQDVFQGQVQEVRMNATTVQNVVTYDTVINFDNPDLKLFPGMTAYVSIPVAVARNVIKVPNAALRYKPDMKPEDIRKLYAEYGIRPGGDRTDAAGGQPAAAAAGGGQDRPGGGTRSGRPGNASGAPVRGGNASAGATNTAVVWELLANKSLQPVQLKTGITDHTTTEVVQVVAGKLQEGDSLITGSASKSARSATAPGFGGQPRR